MSSEVAMRPLLPLIRFVVSTVVSAAVLGSLFVNAAPQCLLIECLALQHWLTPVLLLVPADDLDVRSCFEVDGPCVRKSEPARVIFKELPPATWGLAVLAIGIALARHVTLPCARLALPSW